MVAVMASSRAVCSEGTHAPQAWRRGCPYADTNGVSNVFVHDLATGRRQRPVRLVGGQLRIDGSHERLVLGDAVWPTGRL
jgi:hypothetical protein